MDESDFDKIIKDKLDNFEDPDFDQAALDVLSMRLDTSGGVPWWRSNTTMGIVVGAAILTTIFNIASVLQQGLREEVDNKNILVVDHRIDSLICAIEDLKTQNNLSNLTPIVTAADSKVRENHVTPQDHKTAPPIEVANTEHLVDQKSIVGVNRISEIWITPPIQKTRLVFASRHLVTSSKQQPRRNEISTHMRNKLEKHYFPGVGIYLAPHLDGNLSFFSNATGIPGYKTGIAADVILSPRLSLEGNLDFAKIRSVQSDSYESVPVRPYNEFGRLSKIATTNNLLSGNLSIKYRQWISEKNQMFIKAGASPYFSTGGKYELTYDASPGYDRDDSKPVSQVKKFENRQYFGTTMSFGAGITRTHLQKNKIELGLFYERSFGSNYINGNNLQLTGVRCAYWFHVR